MSSQRRREERKREEEQADIAREAEEQRVAGLTWYERIEEIEDIHDLKVVLHEIVEQLDDALASRGGFERKS